MAKPSDASAEPVVLARVPAFRLGAVQVDPPLLQAVCGDRSETLEPRVMQVLVALAEARGRIVTRDELIARCWDGRVVGEGAIHRVTSRIRHLAADLGGGSFQLENIPRVGYRLLEDGRPLPPADRAADVDTPAAGTAQAGAADPAAPGPAADAGTPRRPRRIPVLAVLATVLALLATAVWWPHPPAQSLPDARPMPALAVLPFRTLAPGARDELLEQGMAETLIAQLSASDAIRVHALGSAQRLAMQNPDPLRVAQALQADYVVDGTVQARQDRVRVNVRLLSMPQGTVAWSDTFDADAGAVFGLQDDIAGAVSQALALKLPAPSLAHRSPCDGGDAALYRQYLGARHLLHAPTPERLHRAIAMFRQILERDPLCARAWAGQAFAWRTLAIIGENPPAQSFPLAEAAIEHALALDPNLVEAHAEIGFKRFWFDWDWAGAEQALQRAIALNPSSVDARRAYAHLLSNLGEGERALEQMELARRLDPMSPLNNALYGQFMAAAGRADQARHQLDHTLQLAPDFWIALLHLGGMEMQRGDFEAAIASLTRATEHSGRNAVALSALASAHAKAGQRDRAEAILRELEQRAATSYVRPSRLAAVEVALGRHERALDLLEQAYRERDLGLTFLRVDSGWNPLRQEPRFIALSERMGLYAEHAVGW
ncbi:tetratricopeptide repeat protein [Pseudoxanthomonas suwonensis]|uniref:OmpR/PhoB-type domain-containing protein n=1 Tax=Pseudoxanthomonas suwonensis TaxID=314722 RepID=A0A0E3Z0E2_9GAMM|nr:FlgO family outer membrane protein [Pseudoxanthomonas suwonensis]AKC86473.1 hypothetical protein WQ53_06530 [Pseudoxanthomonas suwonensis]